MSTPSQTTALFAHETAADGRSESSLSGSWLRRLSAALNRMRAAAEERRVRQHLATIPDALLRDIGIADDEIHRIRACERFTPRAWADRLGGRQLFDL